MSRREGQDEPQTDFLKEIYAVDEDKSDSSGAWSPRSRSRSKSRSRSRSRSPLTTPHRAWQKATQEAVRIADFNAEGVLVGGDGESLMPDAHELYDTKDDDECIRSNAPGEDGTGLEKVSGREQRARCREVKRRGRPRGGRGAKRARGRGSRGAKRGSYLYRGGNLQTVWANDDDLPTELKELVTDVTRRRKERVQRIVSQERLTRDEREVLGESDSESDVSSLFDATDGSGNELLIEGDLRFEWYSMDSFRGQEEPFRVQRTGAVGSYSTPYEAFRSYWDDSILDHIVTSTNLCATKIKSRTFQSIWVPTNAHEILCLFAFWMMLAIIRMPTIRSCFSTDPLLKTSIFRKLFTQSRYESLVRALHFVDADSALLESTSDSGTDGLDRLYSLRPILDHLNTKFKENYVLDKDIAIGESLTLWRGILNFKQYIREKACKFGIKTYELCESSTGYLWSFIVHTGECNNADLAADQSCLKISAIVRKLMEPLLNKGYRLFMDNWYNSPLLARFLKRNGTDCVGTLRTSRVHVSPLIHHATLKPGQLLARHCGDVCVMAWQDKSKVTTISTCHGTETGLSTVLSKVPARPLQFKPQVVLDYNKFKGGVDLKNQTLEPYLIERKRCINWHIKLFKRLLNCSILNARILLQSSSKQQQEHLNFRLQLVDTIITNHLSSCPNTRRNASHSHYIRSDPTRIVNNTHWPVHIGGNERDARNRLKRTRCALCKQNRVMNQFTTFQCEACAVPLCIDPCFQLYHTQS